jgi:hypothetical protein
VPQTKVFCFPQVIYRCQSVAVKTFGFIDLIYRMDCLTECALCTSKFNFSGPESRPPVQWNVTALFLLHVTRSWFLATQRRCIVFPVRYKLNLYMLCRRK